jgi:hypothetical protein
MLGLVRYHSHQLPNTTHTHHVAIFIPFYISIVCGINQHPTLHGMWYAHFTPVRHNYTHYYTITQLFRLAIMYMSDLHVLSVLKAFIPSQNKTNTLYF